MIIVLINNLASFRMIFYYLLSGCRPFIKIRQEVRSSNEKRNAYRFELIDEEDGMHFCIFVENAARMHVLTHDELAKLRYQYEPPILHVAPRPRRVLRPINLAK